MRKWGVSIALAAAAGATLPGGAALAGKEQFAPDPAIRMAGPMQIAQREAQRRVPGQEPPREEEPIPVDPGAVPPADPNLPREFIPIPDRWRLIEAIGVNEKWWDPYNQNTLKGDRPIFDDWF